MVLARARGCIAAFLMLPIALSRPVRAQDRDPAAAARPDTLVLPDIQVIGAPDRLSTIPGSGQLLERTTLENARVFTPGEALRKVPGVNVRAEEGFGLRPNIGIRGLNPTRSTKVLLLEDGVPFVIAPYGDNATYYHPPIDRFDRIEVLKGSGQVLFGPQTIGGVINYITPSIPARPSASLGVSAGNRDYLEVNGTGGTTIGSLGLSANVLRKQGDGARENVGTQLTDANLKLRLALGGRHLLTAKADWYRERSRVTYSGLTEAEWAAAPYGNPFVNDSMRLDRVAGSLGHQFMLNDLASLTTTAYAYTVSRDWWRQSSNSAQRPNDASDPACGGLANLLTTCGNEGRLRDYDVFGVEPRFALEHAAFGAAAHLDAGVRVHVERQDRVQRNSASPNGREAGPPDDPNSGVKERNLRSTDALSLFAQERVTLGRFTVSPGLRLEQVWYDRVNELGDAPAEGSTSLTQLIPGLGATYDLRARATLFAGVHRGFAPPRPEDVIDNSGGVVDLDAELSWNWELGIRSMPTDGVRLDATVFRMDFENQIVPASVAGGSGATLTSAGRTLHQGLELLARLDLGTLTRSANNLFMELAWTWLPTARFEGERYVFVGTGGSDVVGKVYGGQASDGSREQVSVTGNRLPYAPTSLLTASVGYSVRDQFDVRVEGVYTGSQYGDALNTAVLVADGQQGPIDDNLIVNVATSFRFSTGTTLFATVKNLLDETYVVDRTRGLLPGTPRLVQAGVAQRF
jgi:Fe(3+) dicitrate transport protein